MFVVPMMLHMLLDIKNNGIGSDDGASDDSDDNDPLVDEETKAGPTGDQFEQIRHKRGGHELE